MQLLASKHSEVSCSHLPCSALSQPSIRCTEGFAQRNPASPHPTVFPLFLPFLEQEVLVHHVLLNAHPSGLCQKRWPVEGRDCDSSTVGNHIDGHQRSHTGQCYHPFSHLPWLSAPVRDAGGAPDIGSGDSLCFWALLQAPTPSSPTQALILL